MMFRLCALATLFLGNLSNLLGYGAAGHEAIGRIATQYLAGTRAESEVAKLLYPNEDLARAATWADRAKLDEKYLSAEMKTFVTDNPGHHGYHYCDVPFQETAYRAGLVGTNDHDLIHSIQTCIAVLQNPADDRENPLKINHRTALMLLAHFVGDLHQPLHVGCSYISTDGKFVNPNEGGQGQADAGANDLRRTTRTSLHGYWDTATVKLARDRAGTEDFTAFLLAQHPPQTDWSTVGSVSDWPVTWATETLGLARQCYDGIELGPPFVVPKDDKRDEHFEWKVTLLAGYDVRSRDIVEVQLVKAGWRLAELLKAIWPDSPVK